MLNFSSPTNADIDLAGWQLAEAVSYTFPQDVRQKSRILY